MHHLHPRFITAGLGFGIAMLMFATTGWQLWMWTAANQFNLVAWLWQLFLLTGGTVLFFFCLDEIRHEARRSRR